MDLKRKRKQRSGLRRPLCYYYYYMECCHQVLNFTIEIKEDEEEREKNDEEETRNSFKRN